MMEKRTDMTFGDVATFVNGYAFKPKDYSLSGRQIIRIQDLTGNAYQTNYYEGVLSDKYLVQSGDVLISWSASLGVYRWKGADAYLNQHIFKVIFDKLVLDKDYFVHQASYRIRNAQYLAHGATMTHLTKRVFDGLPFVFLSLDEQRHIASVLNMVQAQIVVAEQMLAKADELIQSRFVEMFGDVRDIDKTVPWHRIDEIASTRLGKMLDRKRQTGNWNRKYLGNHNVQWFKFDLSSLAEMDFAPEDQREFELRSGDILMCEGGEVGRCAIWRGQVAECYFQKALHRIRCDSQIVIPEYLVWVFKMMADAGLLVEHTHAVTIAHLPGVRLKALEVPVPSLTLQNEFAEFVTSAESLKSTTQQQLDRLNTLYASLTQRYFA